MAASHFPLPKNLSSEACNFWVIRHNGKVGENGLGCDHGWGGHHFVLGGAVNGGVFYGGPNANQQFPVVSLTSNDQVGQGRLLPTTSVEEYGATFAKWMGASTGDLATVFPNLGRFARTDGMPFLS